MVPQSVLVMFIFRCSFKCTHLITYVRRHSHVLADDNKMPFKCSVAHQLLLKFTKSLTVFEQHCPQYDLNVLVHWLSFFEQHCLQYTDSSFNHLSLPPVDLNTVCFPTHDPLYCLQVSQFFKEYWEELMSFHVKYFADSLDVLHCSTIFLVLESNLIFQRSCLFKSNCWNEIREMSILKSIFGNQACLVKDPTHVIQCSPLIALYFEHRNDPL
jgi:hypothetical protein